MDSQTISILILTCILGAGVLGSYVPIVQDIRNQKQDYWFGISKPIQYFAYSVWILAAIGFLTYTFGFTTHAPKQEKGLFAYGQNWIRPLLIGIALVFSIGWSITTWAHVHFNISKVWSSLCLIITALASILLLAGEVETDTPFFQIMGLLIFTFNTTLIDAVMWNANFILAK
jgi:hypothetical protein